LMKEGKNEKTLAARGLEEPRNSEELLTESVGAVHFSGLIMLFREYLSKFVGPLPFSAYYLKR